MVNTRITKKFTHSGMVIVIDGYVKGGKFVPDGEITKDFLGGKRALLGRYLNGKPTGKLM